MYTTFKLHSLAYSIDVFKQNIFAPYNLWQRHHLVLLFQRTSRHLPAQEGHHLRLLAQVLITGAGRKIIGGAKIHIFVFTECKNNRFQKK